jgi:GT2 family glycosyltransferase
MGDHRRVSSHGSEPARGSVGVVIATRDRREDLLRTLERLSSLPERPPLVVVDNASKDGSVAAVAARFPAVKLVALERNRGAFARNIGVERLRTTAVAFSDDDSWWEPGSLARAADLFATFPRLGLLAARILVGPERRLDPTSALMRRPTPPGLPGPRVNGFLACGAIIRRSAFLAAGGFCERFLIGSEEELLTIDLTRTGWDLCYDEQLLAVHVPHPGDRGPRSWLSRRNALWTSWLRQSPGRAIADTVALAAAAGREPLARRALLEAIRGLPWAISSRRARPPIGARFTPLR